MLKIWDLKTAAQDGYLVFKSASPRVQIPYEPCLGILGLAPGPDPLSEDEDEDFDIRYLTPGSSVSLMFNGSSAASVLWSFDDA